MRFMLVAMNSNVWWGQREGNQRTRWESSSLINTRNSEGRNTTLAKNPQKNKKKRKTKKKKPNKNPKQTSIHSLSI